MNVRQTSTWRIGASRAVVAGAVSLIGLWVVGGANCVPTGGLPSPISGGTANQPPPLPVEPPATQPDSAGGGNVAPEVRFTWPVAPVSIQSGSVVNIRWTVKDPEDAARISILARDEFGSVAVIAVGITGTAPQSNHVAPWDTSIFPEGTYEILATATDGQNAPVTVAAPGLITIQPRPPEPPGPPPPAPPPNGIPSLAITDPSFDITQDIGSDVTVTWQTRDPEDGVQLVLIADPDQTDDNGNEITLVDTFVAFSPGTNNVVTGSLQWDTTGLAAGVYRVYGSVDDLTGLAGHQVGASANGLVTLIPTGSGSGNRPPTVVTILPNSNRGVVNGDVVQVAFEYTNFEALDNMEMILVLDKDTNPNNDDPDNPNDTNIFVIDRRSVTAALAELDTDVPPDGRPDTYVPGEIDPNYINTNWFFWTVDTSVVPVRTETDGQGNPLPYFPRIVVKDGTYKISGYGPTVIFVQAKAQGLVDLRLAGATVAGVTFQGFTANDNIGSNFLAIPPQPVLLPGQTTVDNAWEFLIVGRYGTPRNRGNVGTGQYIFGQPATPTLGRLSGKVTLTSTGTQGFGILFGANRPRGAVDPPETLRDPGHPNAKTAGIYAVWTMPDITGDGLSEIAFGMPYISGLYDSVDTDPCDCAGIGCVPGCPLGSYVDGPVSYPGTASDAPNCAFDDVGAFNLDDGAAINQGYVILSSGYLSVGNQGFVDLQWVGQLGHTNNPVDDEGVPIGTITARTAGGRFRGGWFGNETPPVDATNEFGATVSSISGLHDFATNRPDLIVSAPGANNDRGKVFMFIAQNWLAPLGSGDDRVYQGGGGGQANGNISHPGVACVGTCVFCAVARANVPPPMVQVDGAEDGDRLGQAYPAGDFNQDGLPDLACGAPMAEGNGNAAGGRVYILFNQVGGFGNIDLRTDDVPRLELSGTHADDHFGNQQRVCGDVSGDGVPDVLVASGDYDDTSGTTPNVDAGMVAVVYGAPGTPQRNFTVDEIGTPELPGVRLIGAVSGARAGVSAMGAGDFNADGFADLVIASPGETRDVGGVIRRGVAYLVLGGTHLFNPPDGRPAPVYNLSEVGSPALPGVVFVSPFEVGTDDEAALEVVGTVGDVDGDGFSDIAIGAPTADFIDPSAPGQRQQAVGQAYLIYGGPVGG